MKNVKLLVIEDEHPETYYNSISSQLNEWIFAQKGLVQFDDSDQMPRWVSNYQDWKNLIDTLVDTYDLVFCTIDLSIPENSNDANANIKNGIRVFREIQQSYQNQVRCCILTGKDVHELESHMSIDRNVLFANKGNDKNFPEVISYIKSIIIKNTSKISYLDAKKEKSTVFIGQESETLRELYFSKALQFVNPNFWHCPGLIISDKGLGVRSFAEFIAFLAGSEYLAFDLNINNARANRQCYKAMRELLEEFPTKAEQGAKSVIFISGVDEYQPSTVGAEKNCLDLVKQMLEWSAQTNTESSSPITIIFRVQARSRLYIQDFETRAFLRMIEEQIGLYSNAPLEHFNSDDFGWYVGHPRIIHVPSLAQRGEHFLQHVAKSVLHRKSDELEASHGLRGHLTLDPAVADLLFDKIKWETKENIRGLVKALDHAVNALIDTRSDKQFEITPFHLDKALRKHLENTVLNVDDVSLTYPSAEDQVIKVIDKIDFSVFEGEILAILGPSGSGKSTILRLLAGLVKPTNDGSITYRTQPVTSPRREIGMVFQDYSLYPWLTVWQNVAFGPKNRGVPRSEYETQVTDLLKETGLYDARNSYPSQLSGGMRQRVAIIRAFANESDVILMDEPFGALDLNTRWSMQDFLLKLVHEKNKTVVFVTHDIEEAVYVGDRILIGTKRPLRLKPVIEVPFSQKNRTISLRHDHRYGELVRKVSQSLLDSENRAR